MDFVYLDCVRSGEIAKGKKGSSLRTNYQMALNTALSHQSLDEPGYLIRVEQHSYPEELQCGALWRILRVPKTLSFHQLYGILERSLGWAHDRWYSFGLWEAEMRDAGQIPNTPRTAEKAKVVLVEDPEMQEWGSPEADRLYGINEKSSKTRKLHQVFGGSRVWPEIPYQIDYDVGAAGGSWEYKIEFLGETDEVLEDRPGQNAFSLEGEGWPVPEDLRRGRADQLDLWRDEFDMDYVNNKLDGWCYRWRQQTKQLQ